MSFKRFSAPRVNAYTNQVSITPALPSNELIVHTGISGGFTVNAPTGTPLNGQELWFRFKDDGTGRAITWNAIYANTAITKLATTVANKTHMIKFQYDSTATKWACIYSDGTGY